MVLNFVFLLQLILINYSLCNYCYINDVHALLLARGGSKGINNKNLLNFDGLSILARTIETIKRTGLFENIWVSTDSKAIELEALKYGALIHRRSKATAQDESSSLDAVMEFLNKYYTINRFALFQCTSIFLKESYIKQAFQQFSYNDCVFAVTRSFKLRWTKRNNEIVPLNFMPTQRPRRQDWDGELIETGMFYFSTRTLLEQNLFQNNRCSVVEIAHHDALELDTMDDVVLGKCINQLYQNKNNQN